MEVYDLPAIYQYYSVPKIDPDAFLIAHITDWEKYNLLGRGSEYFLRRDLCRKNHPGYKLCYGHPADLAWAGTNR